MTQGYVYYQQLIVAEEVDKIIDAIKNASASSEHYYFLRYSHKVSGICLELPKDRGEVEGQMFNEICELRWKKYKAGYEALILSKQEIKFDGFESLERKWEICDRNAFWHKEEPKFPKGFIFPEKQPEINQRYFQDSTTATVHFVALTVKVNDSNT